MVRLMKTTVEIADGVLEEARALATKRGTTLRALIEQGLREVIEAAENPKPFKLKDGSFRGTGFAPEFADEDWSRIREAAYERTRLE